MRVQVVGGMCNRLRAMFDWRCRLEASGQPLTAVWLPNYYVCGAQFSDVFQPFPGIEIASLGPWDHVALDELRPGEWMQLYRWLRPTSVLQGLIDTVKRGLAPEYAAIHIRGGDHLRNAERQGWPVLTLEERGAFRMQHECIYTASDKAPDDQGLEDHQRFTPLEDAVVDLFVCAGARHFLGTPGSSFSETIDIIRWLNGLRTDPPRLMSLENRA